MVLLAAHLRTICFHSLSRYLCSIRTIRCPIIKGRLELWYEPGDDRKYASVEEKQYERYADQHRCDITSYLQPPQDPVPSRRSRHEQCCENCCIELCKDQKRRRIDLVDQGVEEIGSGHVDASGGIFVVMEGTEHACILESW